jgi:anti-sigma regulatory factor (Ser/Thr protein kinase)
VSEGRRAAIALASDLRFPEDLSAKVALAVTECATNLWKHAGGGEILLAETDVPAPGSLEVLSLDKGPGMENPARCFQDGYSTAGSSGTGLGAIRRLSTTCELYTAPGKGTVLLLRFDRNGARRAAAIETLVESGGVSVPKRGEEVCGDGFAVHQGRGFVTALVVDGLGHGPAAADSAAAAMAAFRAAPDKQLTDILTRLNGALRSTRGAAASLARLDLSARQVTFAGVGNVMGLVYDHRQSKQMVSTPGTLGQGTPKFREFLYPWEPGALVLLYSDGISTHWAMDSYVNILTRDTAIIAGLIYRDHQRPHDDSTVLALRETNAT